MPFVSDSLIERFVCPFVRRCELNGRNQTTAHFIHKISDSGTGKGIPLQSLPNPKTTDRDRTLPVPQRETNQDLVPEQANEVEEGA